MSWIKKLMNTFFDDQEDDSDLMEDQPVEQPKKTVKEPAPKQVSRQVPIKNSGRTKTPNQPQHTAKMLHKYPETGAFRFPLIPDENRPTKSAKNTTYQTKEFNQEKSVPTRERNTRSNRTDNRPSTAHETRQERKHRPAFKPTNVPSPVYGYEKKNTIREKKDNENSTPVEKSRFTPTDVPSPVYGFGQRKPEGILFIGRDIPEKRAVTEKLLEDVESSFTDDVKKEQETTTEVKDSSVSKVETEPITETENLNEEYVEVLEYESNELNLEPSISIEQEESVEIIEEKTEMDEIVLDREPEPVVEKKEETTSEIQQTSTTQPNPSPKPEQTQSPNPVHNQAAPKQGGQYVPFNVLMLKKDRQPSIGNKTIDHKEERTVTPQPVMREKNNESLFVPTSLLSPPAVSQEDDDLWLQQQEETLQSTLDNFNVNAKVVHKTKGPAVTRFEVQPAPGVKVNKITNLTDDIKLSLAARDIRIEAPIPGKNAIGIEVPNQRSRAVFLREIIEHPTFKHSESSLTVALGLDISGAPVVTDLQKMPHGLIAGATGSGKSVCINSILISLLYKATPEEVRLLLVDPKMVELAPYNNIPHLVTPVITDAKEATAALKWTVEEMERRYEDFAKTGVRDIKRYNEKMENERLYQNKMPYIVVVIDELADLMMVSPQDVEEAICRIAQKARACGIHLLLATQRPSVDVITGLIKANVPTRTAFAVSSAIDSRTILDMSGAERLLGRGDMLFMENGSNKAVRIQGTFVSDEEIEEVTRYVKEEYKTEYLFTREELIQHHQTTDTEDELFEEACYYVIEVGAASSSSLQRRFRIGYNRAARLVDMMESFGLVSEAMGSKPRNVLLTQEELENRLYSQVE